MFDRIQIEKLLKLNGVDATAPEDEIKSVLLSARWHDDDIDTVLLVLKENKNNHDTHLDSVHRTFNAGDQLSPETVSSLLGIDMDVTNQMSLERRRRMGDLTTGLVVHMVLVSLALSVIFVLASMWYLEMGLFHHTVRY